MFLLQMPSPSHDRLQCQRSWPLYAELGKLSRLYGKLIESVTEKDLPVILLEMQILERLPAKVHEGWKTVRWADIRDPSELGNFFFPLPYHVIGLYS
jgi:hypothetical protein